MATAQERAQAHYDRWLQLGTGGRKRIQWTDRGISFIAQDPYLTPDGDGIGVTIDAEDSRGPLPTDNPYQFFNPPLGVWIAPPTFDENGEIVDPGVISTADVIVAAKDMVYDAVVLRAIQLGWAP